MADTVTIQVKCDVSPRLYQAIEFMGRHPRCFAWMGSRFLTWGLVKLFVRVSV